MLEVFSKVNDATILFYGRTQTNKAAYHCQGATHYMVCALLRQIRKILRVLGKGASTGKTEGKKTTT